MKTVFSEPEVLLKSEIAFWPQGDSIVFAIGVPIMPTTDNLMSVYRLEVSQSVI